MEMTTVFGIGIIIFIIFAVTFGIIFYKMPNDGKKRKSSTIQQSGVSDDIITNPAYKDIPSNIYHDHE